MSALPTPDEAVAAMYPSFLAPYGTALLAVLAAEKAEHRAAIDGDYESRRRASVAVVEAEANVVAIGRDLGATIIGGLRLAHQFHPDQVRSLLGEILGIQHQFDAIRSEVRDLSAAVADCEVRLEEERETFTSARY